MDIDTSKSGWAKWNKKTKEKRLSETVAYTLQLFKNGFSTKQIMAERDFKQDSVERQLIELITKNCIEISEIIDEETHKQILDVLKGKDLSTLKPIKEELGEEISWFQIKCVIASINSDK